MYDFDFGRNVIGSGPARATALQRRWGPRALRYARGALLLLLLPGTHSVAELPLGSVGQLLIPTTHFENGYRRHYNERCSATLVASARATHSRWLLTAWHCLEYYGDLSRSITFVHSSGATATATAVISGGGMHADWALLRLAQPMPGPVPLVAADIRPGTALAMAGYSRSVDGHASPPLSLDRQCTIQGFDGADVTSDCHARRGASGGGVFTLLPVSGEAAESHYLGVISRGDSQSRSIFVPLQRLRKAISPYLEVLPAS